MNSPAEESALLLRCPAAEPAVGPSRAHLDAAARVGVPAHVTVTYPFRAVADLTPPDHDRLERLFARFPSFTVTGERTRWFADDVLFVEVGEVDAVTDLIHAVTVEFPEHPPYRGEFAEVVPHLTVGHDHSLGALREAEDVVRALLPFRQVVTEVELWSGPALASGQGQWRFVRAYPLG